MGKVEGNKFSNALVVGGTKGVGFAIAMKLCQQGYHVGIVGSTKENMDVAVKKAKEQGVRVDSYIADVTDEQSVSNLFQQIGERKKIEIYVNCVGKNMSKKMVSVDRDGNIKKLSLEEWNCIVNLNLTSAFLCCREEAAKMIEQKVEGVIVNISTALYRGAFGQCAYVASKAGVCSLTKSISYELARNGIRCIAVAPGAIEGEALIKACERDERHHIYMDRLREQIPIGRFVMEEEVADTVLYVIRNQYQTGAIIELHGGGCPANIVRGR